MIRGKPSPTPAPERPSVFPLASIEQLREQYHNPNFREKIDKLKQEGFHQFRSVRGDGNCFYMSVVTCFIERFEREEAFFLDVHERMKKVKVLDDFELVKAYFDENERKCAHSRDENVNAPSGNSDSVSSSAHETGATGSTEGSTTKKLDDVEKETKMDVSQDAPGNQQNPLGHSMEPSKDHSTVSIVSAESTQKQEECQKVDETVKELSKTLLSEYGNFIKKFDNSIQYTLNDDEVLNIGLKMINTLSTELKIPIPKEIQQIMASASSDSSQPGTSPSTTPKPEISKPAHPHSSIPNTPVESLDSSFLLQFVECFRHIIKYELLHNPLYKEFYDEDTLKEKANLVLQMGEDAEHSEINALLSFFGVNCKLYQLDRNFVQTTYVLPDSTGDPMFHLLYRPGHYDVIYKK